MIYLYFDKTGTLKEVINDESIRRGTTNVNGLAVYCELWDDADFTLDDIWYCQRVSCGKLTPEVSFIENLEIMQVPYKKEVDYKYFKDFKQYKFYVFEFTTEYTQYSGLNVGTVRFAVDDGINALGTITFNIQDNVIKEDNNITQSQYDYLLLSYASRTLNEETGRTLCELIEDIVKEQAKITGVEYVGTTTEILALTSDEGIALSTTNAHIYNWDAEQGTYVDSGIEFMDISLSSNVATLSGNQTFTGNKVFNGSLDVSEVGSNNTSVVNKQYAENINNSAVHKAGTEAITGDKIFTGDIVAMEIKADTHEDLVISDHFGENKITITEEDGLQLQGYYKDNSDNEYYSSIDLSRGIVDLTSDSGIYFYVNNTSIFTATIIANEKILESSGTYLKGFLVKTPTNANDIVNKSYADGIKTTLETALGNKADLNNAEQEITAFEITTENMNVADLYQNGANITLDSAFGGISFKPSGSNKYITIGAGQIKGIDTVSNNTDATNKQYVDGINTNLQSQIDGINAGQNLADIVADLTALNNLSTTNLKVDDKVQVLVDRNHDNASTVYNWNGTTWEYIGKYGQDGYTKAEANTLFATKQNVIDSSHKLSSDLVDDTNQTNKMFKALTSSDIFDDALQLRNLNLMPTNSIYYCSGGQVANAPKGVDVFTAICVNNNSSANFPTNNYGAMQILITTYGIIYTRQAWGWNSQGVYSGGWSTWNKGGIVNKYNNIGGKVNFKNKTALMVGDSITDETYSTRWCTTFKTLTGLSSYQNVAVSGSGWVYDNNNTLDTVEEQLTSASSTYSNVDYVFIASGNNDVASNINISTFATAVKSALTYALTTYTNATIVLITPICKASNSYFDEHCQYFRNIITEEAMSLADTYIDRIKVIQGNFAPLGNDYYFDGNVQTSLWSDATHPTNAGSKILAEYIYQSISIVDDTTKVDMLQPDWADQVYVKKSDGTNSSYYIDFNSTPYSVCIRNATGRLNIVGAQFDSQAINLLQWKNDLQVKRHFINSTINDGVGNLTAIISILSPIATLNTATLIKDYFKAKGYKIPNTNNYLLTDVSIFLTSTSNNLVGVIYDETNDKFIASGTSYSLVSIASETITKDILPL